MLADWISGILGFVGIILCSYGAYVIAPQFGFIAMGIALIVFSYLLARAKAFNNAKKNKK